VGSEKCGECHTKAYEIWSNTPHAHATDSLVKPPNTRGDIARHFDPECLSCHVTGWDPQQFVPLESGYLSLEKTPHLQHNGCENCHGPGSSHVAAETGAAAVDETEQLQRRDQMKLPLAGGVAERKCLECHDDDNSPDFHANGAFERYWKEVEHRGKE
jgi:nitrate reductase cytochrome c-type subunit